MWALLGVPLSLEIGMFLSSGYREGISHMRVYDCFRGEGVGGLRGKVPVTFLLLLFSQTPLA